MPCSSSFPRGHCCLSLLRRLWRRRRWYARSAASPRRPGQSVSARGGWLYGERGLDIGGVERGLDLSYVDPLDGPLGPQDRDLVLEGLGALEGLVDAREPQIGDLVELPQRRQDRHPDLVRRDLRPALAAQGVLHLLAEA